MGKVQVRHLCPFTFLFVPFIYCLDPLIVFRVLQDLDRALVVVNCFANKFTRVVGMIHYDTDIFLLDRFAHFLLIHIDAFIHLAHLEEHKDEAAFALG